MKTSKSHPITPQPLNLSTQQPLLHLPDSHITIYSDCILAGIQSFKQIQTNDTAGTLFPYPDQAKLQADITQLNQPTQPSTQTPQKSKIIMFNNPDYAFKINEQHLTISIHQIITNNIILSFKIKSHDLLIIIQTILRKKMCQLGFQNLYQKIKLLGKGSSAQVHLVQRISDKKLFAAKIVSIKSNNDNFSYVPSPLIQQTFLNQSKLLRLLHHKNIIHLQSLYIHKKQLIQVMQYLTGGTLLQIIRNDQLKQKKQKWKVIKDLVLALDYLRQRRIVHRDIKLENILIRQINGSREYVLSDFGLACWTGEKSPLYQRCGTPGYIAPEVLNANRGKPILNHKGDIFSLGVIAHIIFLHQSLFPYTGNIKQLLRLNKKADYNFQTKIYKQLPLSQKTFLQFTLAKKPQQRLDTSTLLNEFKYQFNINIQQHEQKLSKNSSKQKPSTLNNKTDLGIEIKIKKQTSLTKKKISFTSNQQYYHHHHAYNQQKSSVSTARNIFNHIWNSISYSTPKKQKYKIKDNSVEKYKILQEFV